MNQQILDLIEMAIADGEVSEKERGVILRKAGSLGEDRDEVEMILESKLQQIRKQAEPTTEKAGNVIKCPSCNANIPSFTTKCEYCGHEFRNLSNNKTISDLAKKLEEIRRYIQDKPYNNVLNKHAKKVEIEDEITKLQSEVINNFSIPNTREDILELLHYISPKIKVGISSNEITSAWRNKFIEIIGRAKTAYKNDNQMLVELSNYEKQIQIPVYSKFFILPKKTKEFILYGFFIIAMFVFIFANSTKQENKDEKEKERLELLLNQINDAIESKNYDQAKILNSQIKWEGDDGNEKEKTKIWDEKRENLQKEIDKMKNK